MRRNEEVQNLSVHQQIASTKTLLRQTADALRKGDEFLHGLVIQKQPTAGFERHKKKVKRPRTSGRRPARPDALNGKKKDLLKRACELVSESHQLQREFAFLQKRLAGAQQGVGGDSFIRLQVSVS